MSSGSASLEARVQALGPWFHNLRLGRVQTAPDHPLGDFPSNFWEHAIPDDLSGASVLDIGCTGGFYSFEMKRRGAARVLGVDHDPVYLAQARFAREQLGLDVQFVQADVYEIDKLNESFDYVLFMGVLYHLRHPLYALEKVASNCNGGCESSMPHGKDPWVGCSESGGGQTYGPFSATCRDNLTYKSYVDCVETKWFLGEYRNRAWWLCSSLQAAGKFKVAELKRPKRPR